MRHFSQVNFQKHMFWMLGRLVFTHTVVLKNRHVLLYHCDIDNWAHVLPCTVYVYIYIYVRQKCKKNAPKKTLVWSWICSCWASLFSVSNIGKGLLETNKYVPKRNPWTWTTLDKLESEILPQWVLSILMFALNSLALFVLLLFFLTTYLCSFKPSLLLKYKLDCLQA